MYKIISVLLFVFITIPQLSLAASDEALANAADTCNSSAYDALKPSRKVAGASDLMSMASKGRKYARYMKSNLGKIETCKKEPYLPDCEPASKIEQYHVRLKKSKIDLNKNMLKNYICSAALVNRFATNSTASKNIQSQIESKVNKFIKSARR